MKVYIHQGKGHYIGSVIVVAATNLKEAKELVRKELDSRFLKDEKLNMKLLLQKNDVFSKVLLSVDEYINNEP